MTFNLRSSEKQKLPSSFLFFLSCYCKHSFSSSLLLFLFILFCSWLLSIVIFSTFCSFSSFLRSFLLFVSLLPLLPPKSPYPSCIFFPFPSYIYFLSFLFFRISLFFSFSSLSFIYFLIFLLSFTTLLYLPFLSLLSSSWVDVWEPLQRNSTWLHFSLLVLFGGSLMIARSIGKKCGVSLKRGIVPRCIIIIGQPGKSKIQC